MYDYNDIQLSTVKNLDSVLINRHIQCLIDNDESILPPDDYTPHIWENAWYNKDSIAGYAKGDVLWKWTMTSSEFLSNYAKAVYQYAADNPRLCSYFKIDPDVYILDMSKYPDETTRYENVISGYAEYDMVGGKLNYTKLFPMLFDYCWDFKASRYCPQNESGDKRQIQVYVSLVDNNKNFLSDTASWVNVTLHNNYELGSYISSQFDNMMSKHVRDYHLGGSKTLDDFNDSLLARNLSNFNINHVYNRLNIFNHNQYINSQGFDYVLKFAKKPVDTQFIDSKKFIMYKWFRLWSSGYLEHGGVVEISTKASNSSSDPEDYYVDVDLGWMINSSLSATVYDYYPEYPDEFYGSTFSQLYFAGKHHAVEQRYNTSLSAHHLGHGSRYSISLTPVIVVPDDISVTTSQYAYKPIDQISSTGYPLDDNNDLNDTWLNLEVHNICNNKFSIVRPRTRDLSKNQVRYVQYYTSGYVAKPFRDYRMSQCTIKGLDPSYPYTGSEIRPDFTVLANDGGSLEQGVDYTVHYENNTGPGTAQLSVVGIYPYEGFKEDTFTITP